MVEVSKQEDAGPLPPASLRLLVPPLRLMSAVMWRAVQQRDVMQYEMLADFVSLVTEAVPELFSSTSGMELILGLRAKLILELCHRGDPVDVQTIQPHLSSIQLSLPLIKREDSAEVEETGVYFVELVQTLIKDIQERENYFQNVFPLEFGSSYDSALQTLMWDFLYRLEQFLPVPDLLQTVAWLSTDCSALKHCEESIRNPDCLKTLLHHHKCFAHTATSASSPGDTGNSILSALSGKRERAYQLSVPDPQNAGEDMPVCVMDGTDVETVEVMSHWSEIEIDSNQVVEEACEDNGEQTAGCEQRQSETNEQGELGVKRGSGEEYYLEENAPKCNDGDETEVRVDEKRCDGVAEEEQSDLVSSVASAAEATLSVSVCAEREATFTTRRSARKPKKTWKIKLVNLQKQKRKPVAFGQKRARKIETDPETAGDHRGAADITESPHGLSSNGTAGGSRTFSCPHCPFTHNQERYLKSHIKKIHPLPEADDKEPHVCQVCGKGYRYPGMLKAHERSHTGEQPFQCTASRCGRRFSYIQALRRHRLVHARARKKAVPRPPDDVVQEPEPDKEEPRVYGCLYCSESFSSLSARRDHYKTHPEEELKRCSDCGKRLSCQAALVRHKRGHEGERPHECPLCGSSFACTTSFKRHTLTHQPERPYRCSCGKGFTYKGALLSHQRSHTAERSYRCSQCEKTFLYPGELRKHERAHSDEKPYLCPHCGKSFKRERILRAHVAGHTEEKIFKCSSCSKTFAYKASLTRHELTHSGVRPFLCSDCGKTFFSFGELQKHQRYHTGQKPFQCLHCDKSFTQACYLQLHTRYHTGVRPYSCPQCFKSFFTSCRLKRHMQIHTDHKPYECAECGKRFRQAYVLKVHRRTHLERELRL